MLVDDVLVEDEEAVVAEEFSLAFPRTGHSDDLVVSPGTVRKGAVELLCHQREVSESVHKDITLWRQFMVTAEVLSPIGAPASRHDMLDLELLW
jgi:hypothetical protein